MSPLTRQVGRLLLFLRAVRARVFKILSGFLNGSYGLKNGSCGLKLVPMVLKTVPEKWFLWFLKRFLWFEIWFLWFPNLKLEKKV